METKGDKIKAKDSHKRVNIREKGEIKMETKEINMDKVVKIIEKASKDLKKEGVENSVFLCSRLTSLNGNPLINLGLLVNAQHQVCSNQIEVVE